jgi:outer membrane lipoprotein-sorting protein
MEKAREGVQSLECDLIKHKRVPLFEIDDEFRGALRFRLPRFVRMELKGPVRRGGEAKEEPPLTVTVVNDDFAFIWRVADKQAERFRLPAIKDKRFSERNPLEYGLAAPVRNLERDYYLDLRGLEEVEGRPLLKIAAGPRPHVADAPFRRLYFWVDRETWLPVRYRHVKSDGEVIETYTLRNPRFNVAWKDDPFGPPPRDVQLIAHDLEEPRR